MIKPPECVGCVLYEKGESFAPPEGTGTNHVALVGEALGEMEAKDAKPFRPGAPAGSTLERLLRRAGLARENFVIHNAVNCRPPQNWLDGAPWEAGAISHCAVHRDQMFRDVRPRVFVALGNVALKALTAYGQGKGSISHTQGYILDGPHDGTWVIGTFHPSAIMQGLQGLSGVFIWALQRALEIGRNGFVREPLPLILYPSLDDMLAFERGYNPDVHRLDFDIETPESGEIEEEDLAEDDDETAPKRELSFTIIRASLCYGRYAISFPWTSPYREIAARMLASQGRKGVWNEDFDVPRLNLDGARVNGRIYDWMKYWKHLQPSLPTKLKCRSLEFVSPFYGWSGEPWKSLNSSQPEFYSACDSLALKRNGDGIERDLRSKGAWVRAESHITDVYQVLTTMSRNGLPYSREKAQAFERELQQKWDERFTELQRVVPDELKPSKQKQGYKKVPADTTGLARRLFSVLGRDLTKDEIVMHDSVGEYDIYTTERWCVIEPFLPTSTQQVQALLKHHGLPVGKNRKTKNDSADDEHLRKMIKRTRGVKKHAQLTATLQMIRECKQLSKVLGTYVKGWRPGSDGRIHATPGFWGQMMRISWRRPNISAAVQDKTEEHIAKGFRKCVTVMPGHLLLEADYKGIEAKLVGWYADDSEYMRLSSLGVHDYFCAHILASKGKIPASEIPSLALSDAELKPIFRDLKRRFPKDRDDAKHCIAEGSLVLTDKGLVPIENVANGHKLWDGIEWVSHDGVVDQGIREVITYEGLTATSDHEVFLEDGHVTTFGQAASCMGRLATTGCSREAVRTCRSDFFKTAPKAGMYPLEGKMRDLRDDQVDQPQYALAGSVQGLSQLQRQEVSVSRSNRQAIRWDHRTLLQPETSQLSPLRWARDRMPLRVSQSLCAMDREEPATSYLSRDHYRAHQQRWPLRAGESEVGHTSRTSAEHDPYNTCVVSGEDDASQRFRQSIQLGLDKASSSDGHDWRTNYRQVYDILNAGPRHRFTVANKLVHNCVHGISYGMGPRLMADMYEMPESEAKRLIAIFFGLFPKVRQWQLSVLERASRECKLTNPFTYSMPFWEVHRWDSKRQAWALGEDAKSAIAFLPRDTAAAMLKEVLLRLRHLADDGVMIASTHDSITCEVEEGDLLRVATLLKAEMERGVPELGGLSVGVELKYGSAWHDSELQTLDLTTEASPASSPTDRMSLASP